MKELSGAARCASLLIATTLLLACDSKGSSRKKSTANLPKAPKGSPTLASRPALRKVTTESRTSDGLIVTTRLLVPTLSSRDAVRLLLSFDVADEALRKRVEKAGWVGTFRSLEVTLTGPDGKQSSLKNDGKVVQGPGPSELGKRKRALEISSRAIYEPRYELRAAWTEPVESLFASAGRYRLKLAGVAPTSSGPLAFESAEVALDVKDAALKTVEEIEKVARDHATQQLPGTIPKRSALPVVEDEKGNRVIRYIVPGPGYHDLFTEIVVTQGGQVISMVNESIFRCVARGTSIATPDGDRRVEDLAVGDLVVAYDVETGRRIDAPLEAIWPSHAERLLELTRELTVSGRHPVWADARWTEASAVSAGAELLRLDGAVAIADPRSLGYGGPVYDLSVAWPHTFFAAGVLVHNKVAQSSSSVVIRDQVDARPSAGR